MTIDFEEKALGYVQALAETEPGTEEREEVLLAVSSEDLAVVEALLGLATQELCAFDKFLVDDGDSTYTVHDTLSEAITQANIEVDAWNTEADPDGVSEQAADVGVYVRIAHTDIVGEYPQTEARLNLNPYGKQHADSGD